MPYALAKDTLISEISQKCPRAIELLTEYGLSCANCFLNQFDTVEAGARLHGMSDAEIQTMVDEINTQIKAEAS